MFLSLDLVTTPIASRRSTRNAIPLLCLLLRRGAGLLRLPVSALLLVRLTQVPISTYSQPYSAECQKTDWKTHKKGSKLQQMLNKFNDEHNAKSRARPRTSHCTGCNVKFSEDYPCDDECPTCGYVACESCICHHSRGRFCWQCGHRLTVSHVHTSDSGGLPSGTCHCAGSNFGRNYCEIGA